MGDAPRLYLDLQVVTGDQGLEHEGLSPSANLPSVADFERWSSLACVNHLPAEITIRLVDESEGLLLNQTWRNGDHATNVLSFPAELPPNTPLDLLDTPFLGDIVICVPVVLREAMAQGKTAQAHWAHLVIHGCLHLQGYDHIDEQEALQMESLERNLLKQLGFPDPYFSRPL